MAAGDWGGEVSSFVKGRGRRGMGRVGGRGGEGMEGRGVEGGGGRLEMRAGDEGMKGGLEMKG